MCRVVPCCAVFTCRDVSRRRQLALAAAEAAARVGSGLLDSSALAEVNIDNDNDAMWYNYVYIDVI